MARGRIGAGGPFLVEPASGSFTTTVKIHPVLVISFQTNVRSQLKYRLKTKAQLGKVFGKKSIFPAPIWVTGASRKRTNLNSRIVSRLALGEPTTPVVVVATVKIKPVKFVSLTEFKRNRPKTKVILIPKFGKPTTRTKVVGPHVVSFVSKQRKPIRGTVTLKRPTKPVTVVPLKFRVSFLVLINHLERRRPKTKSGFIKVFGKATTKVKPKSPRTLRFAAQVAEIKARFIPVTVITGKVPRTFSGSVPCPTVITFDALWVADGLTYHKGLSRPTLVITPCPQGGSDVVKKGSLSDMRPDLLSKETVTIDGDLP